VDPPAPDPALLSLAASAIDTRDRRVTQQAASAADHRRRASRAAPSTTRTMASEGGMTMDLGGRAAGERSDGKRPTNPDGRGRAAG
jgi:hypothetical protein